MTKFKKIALLALSVIVIAAISAGVLYVTGAGNEPTVIFNAADGVADNARFSFENVVYGVEKAPNATAAAPYPDLFQIRGAMPGDSFDWDVKITVKNASNKKVKMFVRAENANDDFNTLFDASHDYPPTLTVTFPNGSTYKGYLNGTDAVFIGEYQGSNSSKLINLKLNINKLAGNEIAGLDAEIDWVFYAQVEDVSSGSTTPSTPRPSGPTVTPEPTKPPAPELNTEEHFAYIIGVPGHEVRPELNITRAETATILFRLLTDESRAAYWKTTNPFSDVPSDAWYNNAVSTLTNAGIINGYPDGTFHPNMPVTRAEYAAMFSRFFEVVDAGNISFSDIDGHWAKELILSAASRGFINGYPDGTFRPDQQITRAEAITLTNRVLGRKPDKDHLRDDMIVWVDNTPDKWYYVDVQEATSSHEYQMHDEGTARAYEEWLEIVPTRDWAALEKQWSQVNLDGPNVYSSKP